MKGTYSLLSDRKEEHLRIASTRDVRSGRGTGLDRYALWHCALPEMRLEDVNTETSFLGATLGAPLLISAMTGGTPRASQVNANLAQAAQSNGLPFSVGSQRIGLEQPALMSTYRVREFAPDVFLMANLGAVQLNYGVTIDACLRAVSEIGADALALHLNPLQEAIQPQGNTDFAGLIGKIRELCARAPCPVIVKEVGWGISPAVARTLQEAGVAAIDVAGSGGTSWSRVEAHRVASEEDASVAAAFDDWGIPTATALIRAREACPQLPLIASGGIESGTDIVKCLALGANVAGMARPLLAAALESAEATSAVVGIVLRQVRIAMFCLGVTRVSELSPEHLYQREA
ncbi:MAG: type 2 isopentenyl-diphosphate Delta-isomerase [Chloroflexi bacterium]|nr:type 2 isopentenyl-diphosphate Delta-isomerase [Chloroflexota bacterium]